MRSYLRELKKQIISFSLVAVCFLALQTFLRFIDLPWWVLGLLAVIGVLFVAYLETKRKK